MLIAGPLDENNEPPFSFLDPNPTGPIPAPSR